MRKNRKNEEKNKKHHHECITTVGSVVFKEIGKLIVQTMEKSVDDILARRKFDIFRILLWAHCKLNDGKRSGARSLCTASICFDRRMMARRAKQKTNYLVANLLNSLPLSFCLCIILIYYRFVLLHTQAWGSRTVSYAFLAIEKYQGIFSFHIVRCAFSLPQSNQINRWFELYWLRAALFT